MTNHQSTGSEAAGQTLVSNPRNTRRAPLHVCMFTPTASGGHASYSRELLSEIALVGEAEGIFPALVTAEDLAEEFVSDLYPIHRNLPRLAHRSTYKSKWAWAMSRATHYTRQQQAFLRWIESHPEITAVHFQEYSPWLAPSFFRSLKARGIKLVYTVHNIVDHKDQASALVVRRLKQKAWRSAWRSCDLLLVHTEGLRKALADFLGPGHPRIEVTPHGVWKPSPGDDESIPKLRTDRPARLLFFGVIRPNKGLHVLLNAMEQLPEVHLTIAGEPESSDYMKGIATQITGLCRVTNRVDLIDRFIDDASVGDLFRKSDLVVLPYTSFTSQSGVLHHALTYLRPVVASDLGAMGECLRAWRAGEVVPADDPIALANAIRLCLEPKRHQEAIDFMENVRKDLTWDRMAIKTIDAYRGAL